MWRKLRNWYRVSGFPTLLQVLLEFLVGFIFASSPFWLGAGVFALTSEFRGASWTLGDALLSTFGRGELLIFAVTFLAPMFWTVSLDPDGSRGFPGRPIWVTSGLYQPNRK